MRSGVVPGFLPSRHGFAFPNRWPAGPAFEWQVGYLRIGIGEVSDGLCGGMCFAAADRFLRVEPPPPDTGPPARGTPLFHEIAYRQLDSLELGIVPYRFWLTSARIWAGGWTGHDQVREWRAIRAELDAGRPAMVGLVRSATANPLTLTANHQVLAFAYEAGPVNATIRIYDPNHPGRDDVAIRLHVAGRSVTAGQTTGEPLLGMLSLPYRSSPPSAPTDVPGPAPRGSR